MLCAKPFVCNRILPGRIRRWPRCSVNSATSMEPRQNRGAGSELSKEKNSQQTALFATNSGKRLLTAGDLEGAISQFKSAIQALPGYAPAHFQLGVALQRKGDKAESAREFQKARELDPRLTPPS